MKNHVRRVQQRWPPALTTAKAEQPLVPKPSVLVRPLPPTQDVAPCSMELAQSLRTTVIQDHKRSTTQVRKRKEVALLEQLMLRRQVRTQQTLDPVPAKTAMCVLDTRSPKQRKLQQQQILEPTTDVVSMRRWPLLRKKPPTCAQRMTQELRHERKEPELEPPTWPELVTLRRSVETFRKDVEERQHKPQSQELEDRLDPLRRQLDEEPRTRQLLPPQQEPLLLERPERVVQVELRKLALRLPEPLLDRWPLLSV